MSSNSSQPSNGRMQWKNNNSLTTIPTRIRANNMEPPPPLLQRQRSASAPTFSNSVPKYKERRGSNSVLPNPISPEKQKQAKIDIERELSLLGKYVTSFNNVTKAIICNKTNGYFCTKFKNAYIQTPALMQEDSIDGAVAYINKITPSIKYSLGNLYTNYKRINPEEFVSPNEVIPAAASANEVIPAAEITAISNIQQLEEKLDEFNTLFNETTCKIKDGFFCKKLTNSYPKNKITHNEHVGSAIEYLKYQLNEIQKSIQQYKTNKSAASPSMSGGRYRRNMHRSAKKAMRRTKKKHTKRRRSL